MVRLRMMQDHSDTRLGSLFREAADRIQELEKAADLNKAERIPDGWLHKQDAGHAAHPGFENCEDATHYENPRQCCSGFVTREGREIHANLEHGVIDSE